jgi:hypothetical protein
MLVSKFDLNSIYEPNRSEDGIRMNYDYLLKNLISTTLVLENYSTKLINIVMVKC